MKPTKRHKAVKRPAKRTPADTDRFRGDTFWGGVMMKLKKLGTAIEMYYGEKMNIDNFDYRWVDDRIKHFDKRKRLLTKEEMTIANNLWKKYHPSKNI